jgi:hypothetical protein
VKLPDFAKKVGFCRKEKSLKRLYFRDFPILKSFKSGATREINGNRTGAY